MKFIILVILTIMHPEARTVSPPIVAASKSEYVTEKECKANLPKMTKAINDSFSTKYPDAKMSTLEKCLPVDEAQAVMFALSQTVAKKPDDKDKL
jgi:hypothetical protein